MGGRVLSAVHRVWRALPVGARRAAFARLTAALAPRPDRVAPPQSDGIIVAGELARASGLGQGARLMLAALEKSGVAHWPLTLALPVPGEASRVVLPDGAPAGAALVVHINAPSLPGALLRLPRGFVRGRKMIGYWAWELPSLPPGWHLGAPFVHEIWAPSRFTAAALQALAPGRVRVVPHPVAVSPPVPSRLQRADFGLPEAALVVLVSFSLASSFERKNPQAAIGAFRAAFGHQKDRVLVLKIAHAGHAPADLERLRDLCAGSDNIRLETRVMREADSHALTRCADIVLSLHRSEGFGLVPAEAMCLGRAIIATDYSGTTDFLDAGCAMPIPYRLVAARDPRGVFEAPGAVWAEADMAAAVAALRALAESVELRERLGFAAAQVAPERLGARGLMAAVGSLGLGGVVS